MKNCHIIFLALNHQPDIEKRDIMEEKLKAV
jgi:hypothetical protein